MLLAVGSSRTGVITEIIELTTVAGVPIVEAEREELDVVAVGGNHQGVCLRTGAYRYASLRDLLPGNPADVWLVLDSLQDPQNLGSLLRTGEAMGVAGVIIPEHRAVGVTPAVVNASAGAAEHMRVARVPNLARALDELKQAGAWVIALEAGERSVLLWEVDLTGRVALVVGSEGEGIRRLVLERCDILARLPLHGRIESLNAAVAGSVALYEVLRRRSLAG